LHKEKLRYTISTLTSVFFTFFFLTHASLLKLVQSIHKVIIVISTLNESRGIKYNEETQEREKETPKEKYKETFKP
jgi:hypothetical protein